MQILEIKSKAFETEVLKSSQKVLVDFYADWCGPCKMLRPLLEKVAEAHNDVKFVSINIDENEDLADDYSVSVIPCLVVFEKGGEINRDAGVLSKKEIEGLIA